MPGATTPRRVQVGERFTRYLGHTPVDLIVVEDRGNLGVAGGQVVRVREVATGPYDEEREYEVAVADIPSYGVPPAAPLRPRKRSKAVR